MLKNGLKTPIFWYLLVIVCISALILPTTLLAGKAKSSSGQGAYWKNEPEEEAPPPYDTAIPYSQIASKLREIEKNSNRVKVDVIGQSAGGRNLFLVTLSDPQAMGRLGQYQAIRNTMLKDPEKAQAMIDKFGDFKVPVFINGSIHGNEYEGTDACIRLIETLAFGDSEEVQTILKNVILLVNVVQNPDGRVMGTRRNAKGVDINRDFITQTQPETRATVSVITEWNPNELTIKEFPAAYIIPADGAMQLSSHQPARLVDFLLFNDVQVEKASQSFMQDGIAYPKGTYIVWMGQPKRGMANAILEDGLDVSDIEGIEFYSPPTAWSHPLLWGVTRARMEAKQSIKTSEISKADSPSGSVASGKGDFYAYLPTSLAAFKAVNDLFNRGMSLYRTKSSGTFILPANPSIANELANNWALDVFPLSVLPEDAVMMKKQRIAVYGDEGVAIALDELGFDYDEVSRSDLNAGIISEYNVFLNRNLRWSQLNAEGKASLTAWFASGGDYVGLLSRGAMFGRDAGLINFDSEDEGDADAILNINYDPTDGIAAGFRENGYAYVLGAMWFTSVPADVTVFASIAGNDFLVAGYWPDWQTSGANGRPVILNKDSGAQDTALIVIDATFRGHPKNTFRLVGNAIFNGLD